MYGLLIAGTITMIVPFLLMLSGSVKSDADISLMEPIPQFLYSEKMQFARFQEARYQSFDMLSSAYHERLLLWDQASLPKKKDARSVGAFRQFLKENIGSFPEHFYIIQEMWGPGRVSARNARLFRETVRSECGDIEEYNRRYKGAIRNWNEFQGAADGFITKEFSYDKRDPLVVRYLDFKRSARLSDKVVLDVDGLFANWQTSVNNLAGSGSEFHILRSAPPADPAERKAWEKFVRNYLNSTFVRLTPEGSARFRTLLKQGFPGGLGELNHVLGTNYASYEAIDGTPPPNPLRFGGGRGRCGGLDDLSVPAVFTQYSDFIANDCPIEYMRIDSASTRYREYARDANATMPLVAYDYETFKDSKSSFMKEMLSRNYLSVIQYMVVYGRAVFNTFVFVGLSMLVALTVNPIAAYALSRFNLKNTYMILMFCLATMAFPGAVTMIPNFLLLKEFNLLNSFWALILPGVANGYSIFILKGFFDSIPREIYESAMIDGASEWTMFWRFTMALSTPILALIALGAFTGAYTAFMFALIICPDERMWTMMVWLYQLQQGASQSVIYAALVMAAIPTLLVFVFAQNVIMKGIVIPVEK